MKREDFVEVAEEALDSLPEEFRSRIQNVRILTEDFPPNQSPPKQGQRRRLLLGIFHGVPATKRSVFNLPAGPDHIVLYQNNIEAICTNEAEVRHQIRQTLIHRANPKKLRSTLKGPTNSSIARTRRNTDS
jgi:predicted Zn-dependent protease with MMP-like domain